MCAKGGVTGVKKSEWKLSEDDAVLFVEWLRRDEVFVSIFDCLWPLAAFPELVEGNDEVELETMVNNLRMLKNVRTEITERLMKLRRSVVAEEMGLDVGAVVSVKGRDTGLAEYLVKRVIVSGDRWRKAPEVHGRKRKKDGSFGVQVFNLYWLWVRGVEVSVQKGRDLQEEDPCDGGVQGDGESK